MKLNKKVVLLVNLGSPAALETSAIRKFLHKFLGDRRVVNLPKLLWYPILLGVILPFRAPKLFHQYKKIWLDSESPLIYYTRRQAQELAILVNDNNTIVSHAFSYSTPLISDSLTQLHKQFNIESLTIIPLYPQFSSTTTSAVFDAIGSYYSNKYCLPPIKFVSNFYANELYICAIAKSIEESWQLNGRGQILVFSYHSLPEQVINHGDAYYDQCMETTKLVAKKLNLNAIGYKVAFQSKFGSQKWLSPSTVNVLAALAGDKIKNVDIVCPGFVSDCLETLEEIAITNKQIFIDNGGEQYNYIKCLNNNPSFIQALASLI